MAEYTLPSDLNLQWASSGDILKPSDTKVQQGWAPEIPPRQWFNWLDNRQDQAIAHIAQHGIAVWSSTLEYQAGKSYVQGSDGLVYKALTTNTNVNPVTDVAGNWAKSNSGGLINVRVFTSSTTYTPTPGTNFIIVEVQGGGGGGGGIGAAGVGNSTAGAGGGGGGYGRRRVTSAFSGTVITVGAGGSSSIASAGTSGGSSSFGSFLSASGGTGGSAGGITSTATIPSGQAGQGGSSTSFDAQRVGGSGTVGLIGNNFALAGQGGSSFYAPGAPYGSFTGSGSSAGTSSPNSSGGGGSGAVGVNNMTGAVGGSGGSGVVIVWEYN